MRSFETPSLYLGFIRLLSLLVPAPTRFSWRREWEAEIVNHWRLLQKWDRLNLKNRIDLSKRVAGATRDVAVLQQDRMRLALVVLNIVVALVLGFGAVQEFVMGALLKGLLQPFIISSAAILVCVLFIISAVAMLRRWPAVRPLVLVTGVMSILIHVYGALPPHRNMGYPPLLIGAGYGLVMMLAYRKNSRRDLNT